MSTLAIVLLAWFAFSFGLTTGGWIAWHFATKRLGIMITSSMPKALRQIADDLEISAVYIDDGDEHRDGDRVH